MSEQEEAAWVAAIDAGESVGDLAIGIVNDRCPRCRGPLFVADDPDYGVCLTHGEQFIGTVPGGLDLDARRDPSRLRRTLGDVHASAERDAARRREASRRYWQRKREAAVQIVSAPRRGPAPRPDAAERRDAKQRGYLAAYRARLSPEKAAAQRAQRAAYKRERRAAAR